MTDITINITKMTEITPIKSTPTEPISLPPLELTKDNKKYIRILTHYEGTVKTKKRLFKRLEDVIKLEERLEMKLNEFYKVKF